MKDYRPALDENNVACFYEEVSGVCEYPTTGRFIAPSTYEGDALTFFAEEANSTVGMTHGSSAPTIQLEYSIDDGSTWQSFVPGTTTVTLANVGDSVKIRAVSTNERVSSGDTLPYNNYFALTGKVAAYGSVMSLLKSDADVDVAPDYCFCHLFRNGSSLTRAPDLPATTLGRSCYEGMFHYCTFTTAPELPATALA